MKLRPIIFRGDMVRAILAGTKTQTRRVLTVPWKGRTRTQPYEPYYVEEDGRLMVDCDDGYREASECLPCPYGVPGDELWCRENCWIAPPNFGERSDTTHTDDEGRRRLVTYDADMNGDSRDLARQYGVRMTPSILMPRWASRITLVVRSVRVERLGAITDADAIAEGAREITLDDSQGSLWQVGDGPHGRTPGEAYILGFRQMHKLAADADPWLWVVTFDRKESDQ